MQVIKVEFYDDRCNERDMKLFEASEKGMEAVRKYIKSLETFFDKAICFSKKDLADYRGNLIDQGDYDEDYFEVITCDFYPNLENLKAHSKINFDSEDDAISIRVKFVPVLEEWI